MKPSLIKRVLRFAIISLFFIPVLVNASVVDVGISNRGVISGFSLSCTGTNATAILITGYPFQAFVGEYMRRPCINGTVTFDSFDLEQYLEVQSGGAYPTWYQYFKPPFTLVVKDTTALPAPDAPVYNQIVNISNPSNNFDRTLLSPLNTTYPNLAIGNTYDFNGIDWVGKPYIEPLPPEPVSDTNNFDIKVSTSGDVPRVSINCTLGHDYTLSLVHSDNDVVSYSYGVKQREYCNNGIVTFDGFNLPSFLSERVDPSWWQYIRSPLQYIIKDTTGIYECGIYYCPLINLADARNNFDFSVYLASSTRYMTIASGPVFQYDDTHTIWSNINTNTLVGSSNVLFIPGLEASRLYIERFDGTEDQLWEPNVNSDVDSLYLNTDGSSIYNDIYTRDVIKETNAPIYTGSVGQNIYKSFSQRMDDLVNNNIINRWEPYAYDWRQGVEDIVNNGTNYKYGKVSLEGELEILINSSKNGKVTIVAHSNGGLIAKALLKKLQADKLAGKNNLIDKVDVLVLVSVPQIGTAKAIPSILHGYDSKILFGLLMNQTQARELGRNMISAHGLLPSREYIDHVSLSPVTFVDNIIPSGVTTDMVSRYGTAINSYVEYKDFLFGLEGRTNPQISQTNLPIILSQDLFKNSEDLHNKIDSFIPPSNMRVIEIAGWGLDTIASFEYYPRYVGCSGQGVGCISYVLDQRPRFTNNGDKTVVSPSALYMSSQGNAEKYWIDISKLGNFNKINHATIFDNKQLNDFIVSLIEKSEPVIDNVFTNIEPRQNKNNLRISIHSPVTLDAYDVNGNHTGKSCSNISDFCYIQENISNSSYLEFGEGKYINLPEDQLDKVKLIGTDIGTFTFESERVFTDGTSTTTKFINIPVTYQSIAEIIINPQTNNLELKLDVSGDGVYDITLYPNLEFDPVSYLKVMKETVISLDISQSKKNNLTKKIDIIIRKIQNGKLEKAKLRAEKFANILGNKINKEDKNQYKKGRISKEDAQLILDMINKLLDNLE